MSLYVDSSALLKRYVEESDSALADQLLTSDPELVTAAHTEVEVRRNLARLLDGSDLSRAREFLATDLESFALVELDAETCELAATIAETTLVRTLDALHLAAAQRVGGGAMAILTFDLRQAQAARALGLPTVGS
ncbi:MAG: type II toxin-antitoxin system VapC family toxin [Solirubrobacterales bacterium]